MHVDPFDPTITERGAFIGTDDVNVQKMAAVDSPAI